MEAAVDSVFHGLTTPLLANVRMHDRIYGWYGLIGLLGKKQYADKTL
jgi:hypothetical protein